jgi:hypothetical protein
LLTAWPGLYAHEDIIGNVGAYEYDVDDASTAHTIYPNIGNPEPYIVRVVSDSILPG